jgi:hypothetical protein
MTDHLDPELNAYIFGDGSLSIQADVTPEASHADPIAKLFSDAVFDQAIGTPGAAVALQAETSHIHKRAGELWRHEKTPAPAVIVTDEEHQLAKMETGLDRRKRGLSAWMRGELALGKSARELIDHAARHDQETANLLQEVADELEAA